MGLFHQGPEIFICFPPYIFSGKCFDGFDLIAVKFGKFSAGTVLYL